MRQKRLVVRGLMALLLCIFTVNASHAAPLTRGLVLKPEDTNTTESTVVRPNIPSNRLGGGSDNSKISNVTVTAQSECYTGTVAYVGWQWPGHERDQVDVILDGKKLNKDGPWMRGQPFSFYIPYALDQRDYSVTVRSVSNPDNKASGRISVKLSYLMPGEYPEKDVYYIQGSPLVTEWSYKGNPGPVKLELCRIGDSTSVTTMHQNLSPGNYGNGRFSWTIPANFTDGRYMVSVTSVADGRYPADSKQFYIGKEPPPVLKSLAPLAASTGSTTVTVQGSNLKYLPTYKAMIQVPNSDPAEAGTGNFRDNQFDLTNIPNIYENLNKTEDNAQHRQRIMQVKQLYMKKNQVESNRLGFNIRSPYPILDRLNNETVYPGDTIVVYGGNWEYAKLGNYTVILHLPGGTFQTRVLPIGPAPRLGMIPYLPGHVLNGVITFKVPDVFAGKSAADQDTINKSTAQLSIFGPDTLQSNKLNINIRKKSTIVSTNPERVPLAATYAPQAPARTTYYTGNSQIITGGVEKTVITMVRNNSQYSFKLAYKLKNQVNNTPIIWLAPGQSTTAFNNLDANGEWEAFEGPESGSFLEKYPTVGIDIFWRKQ